MSEHHDDHDLGLAHDLPRMLGRRRLLTVLGGLGLVSACAPAQALDCVALPWETAGPYPADGTNARAGQVVNVLTQQGVIRQDLRTSFAGLSGTAEGAQMTLELTLQNADGCTPLAGHAIYLWHCNALGEYSLYDLPQANYLRGVGVSDAQGVVRFTTIFPGCYDGRWPHLHFEIFTDAAAAVSGQASLLTAQIALPQAECRALYAADARYPTSSANLGRLNLSSDNVFGDNSAAQITQQTLSITGDTTRGYLGKLVIPVDFTATRSQMRPPPAGPGGPPAGPPPAQ